MSFSQHVNEDVSLKGKGNSLPRMAPHLAESQHVIIGDMIASKSPFKAKQIANVAGCSRRAIQEGRDVFPKPLRIPLDDPEVLQL